MSSLSPGVNLSVNEKNKEVLVLGPSVECVSTTIHVLLSKELNSAIERTYFSLTAAWYVPVYLLPKECLFNQIRTSEYFFFWGPNSAFQTESFL